MLKQRIITALVLIPIALGGFFLLEGGAFALFIGVIAALGAWEWAQLAGISGQPQRCAYATLVVLLAALLFFNPALGWPLMLLSICWWIAAIWLLLGYPDSSQYWQGTAVKLLIGLVILLPLWQGLVLLKQMPMANSLILALMLMVWGADTGAYFSGRAFGRRKLAPAVSPGKSWEGVIGGILTCLVIVLGVALYQQWSTGNLLLALLITTLVVLISVVGDLTESMFKRQAGVKDSSNLLPGHGGVLDRIDSLTAAVPVFAVLAGWLTI